MLNAELESVNEPLIFFPPLCFRIGFFALEKPTQTSLHELSSFLAIIILPQVKLLHEIGIAGNYYNKIITIVLHCFQYGIVLLSYIHTFLRVNPLIFVDYRT